MSTPSKRSEYCIYGVYCDRRSTCQFIHQDEYDSLLYNSQFPHNPSISMPNNCYNNPTAHFYQQYDSRHQDNNFQDYSPLPDANSSQNHGLSYSNNSSDMSNYSVQQKNHQAYHEDSFNKSYHQTNKHYNTHQKRHQRFNNCKRFDSKSEYSNQNESEYIASIQLQQIIDDIQILIQKTVPELSRQHQALINQQFVLLDDLDDDDDARIIKEAALEELQEQLNIFQQTINGYSGFKPLTLKHAKYHWNRLQREIRRLKARLPIYAQKQQLIDTIRSNRVVILKADTGSGKSSQLVQYLFDAGFADRGQIVCSQPRRLAVRELASRVAKEFGCQVGEEVGCHVGASFPKTSRQTRIRFVTDAVLLNEYQADPMLKAYSLVIIDEAHERRVDTDLLFGAMKLCLKNRSDMKLVIMSATLDDKLLRKYYNDACLIEVPGRTYPIEDTYATEDAENHVDAAIEKVLEIHASKVPGDILVFLTGQDEIDRAIDFVTAKIDPPESALVLPLHGKLSEEETQAVFQSMDGKLCRKIIFSTNVAETSITIDGIQHVVDSGMVKEVMWDSKRHMRMLKVGFTTQSSVKQRRGRAGRTSAGKCYHLYTYETYQSLEVCSRAEILCIQPSIAVLKLKHLNIVDDISQFDWLEPPSTASLKETVKNLTWLGALDSENGKLTTLGRQMAKLGLEPSISVMILTGKKTNCLSHVLALAGMLSIVQNIWWRSKDDSSKQMYDEVRASFVRDADIGGDYIVLLRIFVEWYMIGEGKDRRRAWCIKHMIRWKAMKMAFSYVRELAYQIDPNFRFHLTELTDDLIKQIVQCISAGFFQNLAISNGPIRAGYQLVTNTANTVARIHRSSIITFSQQSPKFILYNEILNINETNFLSVICPIELEWLNKSWLDSLPCSPSQCAFDSYTFVNLGPILIGALAGKRFQNISQLEEQLNVLFEIDYAQSKITIWGQKDTLTDAQQYIQNVLNREREKLNNEIQEFNIIGSTRILLGPGAQPRLVLIEDEYLKILLKNLPKNINQNQIQELCEPYGKVRNVTIIRRNESNSLSSVTFVTPESARTAVAALSRQNFQQCQLVACPSFTRKPLDTNRHNYKLKLQWYLTESKKYGRIIFSQLESAQKACEFFTKRHKFRCQLELNSVNPTIRCSWPLAPHFGHAIIHFSTVEQAQQAIESHYEYPFRFQPSRRSNDSIYVRNIPPRLDEFDLKTIFKDCINVLVLRNRRNVRLEIPKNSENIVRELFSSYSSFQEQTVFIEPEVNRGCVIVYAQFTNEQEMRQAVLDHNDEIMIINSNTTRISVQEHRRIQQITERNAIKKDEYRVKLYQLPSHIDERFLLQEIEKSQFQSSMVHTMVYREKLSNTYFSNHSQLMLEENEKALNKIKALFLSNSDFRSEPEFDVRPLTEDGRGAAFIRFNDPRDVIDAMNSWDSFDESTIKNLSLNQLQCFPIIIHKIFFNEALGKALDYKIEQAMNTIQNNPSFPCVNLFKKTIVKDEKNILLVLIRGTNLKQIYKARIQFDDLLKSLDFPINDHSWSSILFDTTGKKFLNNLQNTSGTYIWWNWGSTYLRIYGEDQACENVYKQIDAFIRETLSQREHSVSIPIPQECIRQCIQNSNNLRELNNKRTKVIINMTKRTISINGDRAAVTECEQKIQEFLDKFKSQSNNNSMSDRKTVDMRSICSICCSNFDKPYTLQRCGHRFCQTCLIAHFNTYFNITVNVDAFKLTCPFYQCNEVCLIRDIISVLDIERTTRLATLAFQVYIRQSDNELMQCIGIDCNQVYRASKSSSTYFCDQCIKVYCTSCKVEYHTGMTCDQYKKLYEEKDENAILVFNMGKLPYKLCPKCETPIEKYTGCNAVRCTLCNTQFCWRCKATDEEDIHRHFTDENSPCYNRMLDAGGAEDEQ